MGHGGVQAPGRLRRAEPERAGPGEYRNVLREPRKRETCAWPGEGPAAAARLRALAVAHGRDGTWEAPLAPGPDEIRPRAADENPGVPAGYTYLLQLAGHDILHSSLAFPALRPGEPSRLRNLRTLRLDLDTIYGRGPTADPIAYAVDRPDDALRSRFRLALAEPAGPRGPGCPAGRDLGRGRDWGDGPRPGPTDAFVADPRNDDNGLLSQTATLFMMLHGALHDAVLDAMPTADGSGAPLPAMTVREAAFAATRLLVERAWRRILRHDLLPRLLDPAVLEAWAGGARLQPGGLGGAMPLELSHGVLRTPHVMVRGAYRLRQGAKPFPVEEVLRQSSRRRLDRLPARADWTVQWSCLYAIPGLPEPQLARRIGPSQPRRLDGTQPRLPNDPAGAPEPLVKVDHVRGAQAELWAVEPLIAALPKDLRAIPGLGAGTAAREARTAPLRRWLTRHIPHPFEQPEAEALLADPPLRLFVEVEAMGAHDGRRFGPLGSALLAELFFEALGAETPEGDALAERLAAAAPEHAETFRKAEAVRDMPALLRFLAPYAAPSGVPFL